MTTPSKSSAMTTTKVTVNKATTEEHLTNLLTNPKSFSIAAYLNTALASSSSSSTSEEEEELQTRMAELALQLQVQTQSCHDEIGRIGAELRAILPRCAGDLGRLHVGLGGMKDDAVILLEDHLKSSLGYVEKNNGKDDGDQTSTVTGTKKNDGHKDETTTIEEESNNDDNEENEENIPPHHQNNNNNDNTATSTPMTPLETLETLSTLHALQQNLTQTKSILHSVSTYDKTITTLPSLLTSSQNLNHAVSALITLENGARALSAMPGHNQRLIEIQTTREKIITLLKPELLHALKKMESRLGPLQTCVGMYNSLGKIESLMEEYVKNRPSSIHKLWFEFGKTTKYGSQSNSGGGGSGAGSSRKHMSATTREELEFYGDDLDDKELFGDDFEHDNDVNDDDMEDKVDSSSSMVQVSFVEWLPTWYEAVLLLLSEEQRRALTVFGPELASEIMAKVCIRYSWTTFFFVLLTSYQQTPPFPCVLFLFLCFIGRFLMNASDQSFHPSKHVFLQLYHLISKVSHLSLPLDHSKKYVQPMKQHCNSYLSHMKVW